MKGKVTEATTFCYNFHDVSLLPVTFLPHPSDELIHTPDKHPRASPHSSHPCCAPTSTRLHSPLPPLWGYFFPLYLTSHTLLCLLLLPAKPPSLQFASHIYSKSLYSVVKEWKHSGCWSGVAAFVNFFFRTTDPFEQCLLNGGVPDIGSMI